LDPIEKPELALEVLKLATQERMCDGNADRAVAVAKRLWEFLKGEAPPKS
jgi:hypothetical protein